MAFDLLNTSIIEGGLRRCWRNAGTPTSGTSGTYAGSADPGDILIDTDNKKLYVNTNTAASPTWSQIVTAGVAFSGDLDITGDITLATEDVSVAQGHLIYLDGQDGGEYIISDAVNELTIRATTTLNLAIGSNDEVSISSSVVTIATNDLALSAGDIAVAQGHVVYFDGQDGGEYIYSSSANELDLNATTEILFRIGGTSEIALTASTLTISGVDVSVTTGKFISGAPVKQTVTTKSSTANPLLAAESGLIKATTDGIYLYLPAVGNAGLTYTIKVEAAYSLGVMVSPQAGELIDGVARKKSSAIYDMLSVMDNGVAWDIVASMGTWS